MEMSGSPLKRFHFHVHVERNLFSLQLKRIKHIFNGKWPLCGMKERSLCGCDFDWVAETIPSSPVRQIPWARNSGLYLAKRWHPRMNELWKWTVTVRAVHPDQSDRFHIKMVISHQAVWEEKVTRATIIRETISVLLLVLYVWGTDADHDLDWVSDWTPAER